VNPEPLVHLGLSHKAAKVLDQMIDACHVNADGEPMDFVDDDDKYEIAEAIKADIKEQMPAPKKGTKRKKGIKK
jgi:hypothetical protein